MTRLSSANLEVLRTRPQSTKLNLSIFQPTAIFKAQVNNASAGIGDRVITFDNVTLGVYTYIMQDMTMWVGSTPGGMELGKIRVRSATSTTITVSENNDIPWTDNAYLTVFEYWELWPVYPRIIKDPNNDENVIFYKDYDIPYTNQNDILGTYVNAGPHRAVMLDPASGQAQVYYSSTGSYNLLGVSLNYNWFFEGATVTGSSSADPGYITYNTPGHYVTRLIISGSNGCIDTTYRYVSVYDQAHPPIQRWQLEDLQGSRDEGGYTASLKVFEIIPIQEHAVVVLFGDNYYGNTKANLGGNYPNGGDTFFVGYIDKDSIRYDYQHSEMTFDAVSLTQIMKKSSGFSVSVKSVINPNKWFKLIDMDGRRALYHYLRWHTTALNIGDFQFVGDDYKIQFFDSDRGSMYDAINNYMDNTLIGQTVADRQSKTWMEVQAMAYNNPTGSFSPPVMDITRRDWMNEPTIEERLTNDVSYMEYGGVAYSGVVTGTFKALIGSAPGNAPGFYGDIEDHQGMALLGQRQLNQLVGNLYANRNSEFPTVGLDMSINAGNLDIAPQETLGIHIAGDDTVRNVAIDGLYIPNSMSWKYSPESFTLLPSLDSNELVNGQIGETVTIPSPDDVGGGYNLPPLQIPPLPDLFPPTTSDSGDGAPPRVLVHDPTYGLIYTQTFNTPYPTWYQINGGLTAAQYQGINEIVVCPNGSIYVAHSRDNTAAFLARADFVGGIFTVLFDQAGLDTLYGSANAVIAAINCNNLVPESLALVLEAGGANAQIYTGFNATWTLKQTITSWFANGGAISYGGTPPAWVLTGVRFSGGPIGHWWVLSADASTTTTEGDFTGAVSFLQVNHVRAGTLGDTKHWVGNGNTIAVATNNMSSIFENIAGVGFSSSTNLACDSTGVYVMGRNGTNALKSSDGGYSWSAAGNLPVLQTWHFDVSKTESQKWVAVHTYIYYSGDFYNTYPADKRGNIASIVPILNLDNVKIIQ